MFIVHAEAARERPKASGPCRIALALTGLVVAACGEEGPIRPAPGDVRGIVVDRLGRPAAGVSVFVADRPPVTSEGDGTFTVADVPAVYDATLISSPFAGSQSTVLYKGLMRRDPVLREDAVQGHVRHAIVAGWMPPSHDETCVIFAGEGYGTWQWADRTTGEFGLSVGWDGADRLRGSLHVLRWSIGLDSLPADFDAYATRDLWLVDGDSISTRFEATDLVDPMEKTISGNISIPSGYDGVSYYGILFGRMNVKIGGETSGSRSFEFRVPDLPELDYYVGVEAHTSDIPPYRLLTSHIRTGIAPGMTGISIALEPAPQLLQPVDLASGVTPSTPFIWSDGTGISVMVISPIGGNNFITVIMARPAARLPDLSAHGIRLPAGREIGWWVLRYPLLRSMDQVASGRFGPLSYAWDTDAALARSQFFRFTMAP